MSVKCKSVLASISTFPQEKKIPLDTLISPLFKAKFSITSEEAPNVRELQFELTVRRSRVPEGKAIKPERTLRRVTTWPRVWRFTRFSEGEKRKRESSRFPLVRTWRSGFVAVESQRLETQICMYIHTYTYNVVPLELDNPKGKRRLPGRPHRSDAFKGTFKRTLRQTLKRSHLCPEIRTYLRELGTTLPFVCISNSGVTTSLRTIRHFATSSRRVRYFALRKCAALLYRVISEKINNYSRYG